MRHKVSQRRSPMEDRVILNGQIRDARYNATFGKFMNNEQVIDLDPEAREMYCEVHSTMQQMNDLRVRNGGVAQFFTTEREEGRQKVINLCKRILFRDYDILGRKARETLWRSGYYEIIAIHKRQHALSKNSTNESSQMVGLDEQDLRRLKDFLLDAIESYKNLITIIIKVYNLNLSNSIDFTLFWIENGNATDNIIQIHDIAFAKENLTNAHTFAMETVHALILSLGDLQRYMMDFKLDTLLKREAVEKYYWTGFRLNSTNGNAQNKLGTLYAGRNYDMDSIYHYLFSLVCIVPFELSETNVKPLFEKHRLMLQRVDNTHSEPKNFFSRFYNVIDVLFFDKEEVPEFKSICHNLIIDLLSLKQNHPKLLTDSNYFEMVSMFFFCMSRLKMIKSPKVTLLNAFLMGLCNELLTTFLINMEKYIEEHSAEQKEWQGFYQLKFDEFERKVHKSRMEYRNWLNIIEQRQKKQKLELKGFNQKQNSSFESRGSQQSMNEPFAHPSNKQSTLKPSNAARSSDEAKESDLKTPLSCKSKRRGMRLRRRKRKTEQSDDSSCYDSESEMGTDFYSEEEDYTDLSSNIDGELSDFDAIEINGVENDEDYDGDHHEDLHNSAHCSQQSLNADNGNGDQKAVDAIVTQVKQWSVEVDSEELLREYEVVDETNDVLTGNEAELESFNPDVPPKKIVYRNKYCKISPMIIVDFVKNDPTFRSLKLLFDWIRLNSDFISNCHHTNPEFVHKIMKLLNYCNIDTFTRKVFFEPEFLNFENVRKDLCELHDMRHIIPLSEDFIFKGFDVFLPIQDSIDWEASKKLQITSEEELILRMFRMVDFGFFLCKQKIYGYRFCVKSRRFTENQKKKREMKEAPASRRRDRRSARNANRRRANEGRTRRYSDRRNGIERKSYTSNEEKDTVEEGRIMPRKNYMRPRNTDKFSALSSGNLHGLHVNSNGNSAAGGTSASTTTNSVIEKTNGQSSSGADEERSEARTKKAEVMAKLCKHVEELEEQLPQVVVTPFIVVDVKALTEYTEIVKNLVKSGRVIVLIPNVVLQELDEMKKSTDKARNAIRWLEQEFTRGNRHLRAQRDNENLNLLLKLPNKLDRDAQNFVKVSQFCNHLVCNYTNTPESKEFRSNIVTYLSGDNWQSKNRQQQSIKYTGILDSIPVRYDQIEAFYAKFKPTKK